MYNTQIPLPACLGVCGALAGLAGGGCNQVLPIWIGATVGVSVGCVICMYTSAMPEQVPLSTTRATEPIVIQNIYITHVSGQPKDIQIARVVG